MLCRIRMWKIIFIFAVMQQKTGHCNPTPAYDEGYMLSELEKKEGNVARKVKEWMELLGE